jgi:hypothetical protein
MHHVITLYEPLSSHKHSNAHTQKKKNILSHKSHPHTYLKDARSLCNMEETGKRAVRW